MSANRDKRNIFHTSRRFRSRLFLRRRQIWRLYFVWDQGPSRRGRSSVLAKLPVIRSRAHHLSERDVCSMVCYDIKNPRRCPMPGIQYCTLFIQIRTVSNMFLLYFLLSLAGFETTVKASVCWTHAGALQPKLLVAIRRNIYIRVLSEAIMLPIATFVSSGRAYQNNRQRCKRRENRQATHRRDCQTIRWANGLPCISQHNSPPSSMSQSLAPRLSRARWVSVWLCQ